MNKYLLTGIIALFLFIQTPFSQNTPSSKDTILETATLETCILYAQIHKPLIQQSLLDQETTELAIKGKLADWYPQINLDYNLQHIFQLPTSFSNNNYFQSGTLNTSTAAFSVSQSIFNKDLFLARQSANEVRNQSKLSLENNKIQLVVTVSKAFYDVLLSQKQINVLQADIIRLETSYKNAFNQYKDGIVDKIDYKRASIALNNAKAQLKNQQEFLKTKEAILKNAMGYSANGNFTLVYDTIKMQNELLLDTLQTINYSNRIEYKQLETVRHLQEFNLQYAKYGYYPSVSAFGNYNFNFLNNNFGKLYGTNFPNSYAGIKVNLPLFQGNKRVYQTKAAEIAIKRVDWDLIQLRNSINTQYEQALSSYKSSLNDYLVLKENLQLANEVYNTIQLQYKSGIKNYLEVITAETDLRNAQINYTNALYQVLAAKVDVQQALGIIK